MFPLEWHQGRKVRDLRVIPGVYDGWTRHRKCKGSSNHSGLLGTKYKRKNQMPASHGCHDSLSKPKKREKHSNHELKKKVEGRNAIFSRGLCGQVEDTLMENDYKRRRYPHGGGKTPEGRGVETVGSVSVTRRGWLTKK